MSLNASALWILSAPQSTHHAHCSSDLYTCRQAGACTSNSHLYWATVAISDLAISLGSQLHQDPSLPVSDHPSEEHPNTHEDHANVAS